jgi:serine protease AprX
LVFLKKLIKHLGRTFSEVLGARRGNVPAVSRGALKGGRLRAIVDVEYLLRGSTMKRLALLVILALTLPVLAAEFSPILERYMARADEDELLGVWAFFADKGFADPAELEAALDDFVASMNPERYARRALHRPAGSLADERDLPVHQPYVEAVTPLVTRYIGASSIANAVCFEATVAEIHAVADLPFVVRLQPTATSVLPEVLPAGGVGYDPTDLDYGPSETQITQIQVDRLHDEGYTGVGVTVLMLDTGFRTDHEAFGELDLKDEWDFVNDDDDVDNEPGDDPYCWYHGTYTWSALGGYYPMELIGPAYGASFLLAKTEDVTQEVHDEEYWYQSGLHWGEALGADVSSSSLGYRYFDDGEGDYSYEDLDGETTIVALAVNWARDNGMLHANSMGNDGPGEGTLISPADSDGILAVGAVDANGDLAHFSSWGPTSDGRTKPEVCALGLYTYAADADDTDTYGYVSGTSLSCPLVGGVLALLREINPHAGVAEIRQALLDTATNSDDPDDEYGWGIVQAYDAAMELHMDVLAWESAGAERTEDGALLSWRITTDSGLVGMNVYRLIEPAPGADYASAHLMRSETAFAGEALGAGYRPDAEGWTLLNSSPLPGSETGYYLDTGVPGAACYYRFEVFDAEGCRHLSPQVRLPSLGELPSGRETRLGACYPNPASGRVNFTFELAEGGTVELAIYDLSGRRVAVIIDAELAAGRHGCVWEADVPTGVYLYQLSAGGFRQVRRLVLVR